TRNSLYATETERRHMANAEKVAAVAELTERFKDSSGAVLTEYRGLTVAQLAELRRSLGKDATFTVVKNTLTKIAVTEAGLERRRRSTRCRCRWPSSPRRCAPSARPPRPAPPTARPRPPQIPPRTTRADRTTR